MDSEDNARIGYPGGNGVPVEQTGQELTATKPSKPGRPVELFAKTYVIAAEIYFELQGKRAEYQGLAHSLPELKLFGQQGEKIVEKAKKISDDHFV